MIVLYSLIAILVSAFLVGMFFRKRIHQEVDRLEDWKNKILNRSIPEEIGRVKNLHMSGETEEKFELWRNEWDDIVGVILPDIEEELFNIEEFASKYRFKRAKELINHIEQRLKGIDDQLQSMLADVNHFVESEEKNRKEIGAIREKYEVLEKDLLRKRGSFGLAIERLDQNLMEVKQGLATFDQATADGNYLMARSTLEEVHTNLEKSAYKMEQLPSILVQLQATIPSECKNLRIGIKEMEDSGYYLKSLNFENRIQAIENELNDHLKQVKELQLDGIEDSLVNKQEQIEQMYLTLEEEVDAKKLVLEELPGEQKRLLELDQKLQDLMTETNHVQLSYRITDEELKAQDKVRKKLQDATKQIHVIVDVAEHEKQTFTSIQEMLEKWKALITQVGEEMDKAKEKLDMLREDEWKAKETVTELRQILIDNKRLIRKSNIPGLPLHILEKLKQGEEMVHKTTEQLEQVPLEMGRVNALIKDAVAMIADNETLIKETIEQAELAERLIQFGNRYRSTSGQVSSGLNEAEQLFRSYHYEEAIELTIQILRPIDPSIEQRFFKDEEVTAS
ncbi:septation ring formation regulator EzrA [Alkalihalobacillus pseudalcaliphilus]|uniref:septation ring formation regulator EzrA n=1 Tax=Alkalihalobacillus pseudalcaliphilus TaxID=79884 RepID=UPI00064D90D2|nr:septation ring formation regulator EzrA [Alkalihalobacillus pseudalcaliphilus]KMK77837.1 selenide, water dikinase [Alkalihalobacillus pseudalcaliphilus]